MRVRISRLFLSAVLMSVPVFALSACTGDGDEIVLEETVVTDTIDLEQEFPLDQVELVKTNAETDESIAICVLRDLYESFGEEKAAAIIAEPIGSASEDRVALDQAVSDCRG